MGTDHRGLSWSANAAAHAFAVVLACGALLCASDAHALTKMREGFASMVLTDGTSLLPRNRISRAQSGDDVIYWIQWKEPVPRSQLRCVITGPDTNLDDTENFADPSPEGYSICGMSTEEADGGTYVFAQYLNGEKVGEQSILVEKPPFFKNAKRQWKWMMGGLALIVIAGYWMRRKMTGDERSLKQVISGEPAAEKVARRPAVTIGSRAGTGVQASASAAPAPTDEAEDLRKLGVNFQWLLGQPDKPQAMEAGRRYIGLLIGARN